MTEVKNNWKGLITVANFMIILAFIVSQSKWQQKVDSHIQDKGIHMPLENKIQTFVPRTELNERLQNIEKQLNRIEAKIK